MKKLITLLAVFGVATTAYADDHMKQNGSFRVIYNNTNNTTNFDDNTGDKKKDIMQRLIWAPTFKVSDAVSVHATLVHSSVWGNNEDQIPGGQNNENDSLIVNEAYANWMVNDESMIRVGRGSYTAADGRVISANSWEQVAKAFEGLMYSHDAEFARAGLFAVRGATGNGSNDSGNFFGANIDFKNLPEFFKMANLHYIIVKRDASTYPNLGALSKEDSTRLGLTLGGDTAGFDYNFTYAMYSGELSDTHDVDASMMDLIVGYSLPDMMNSRFHIQYHSDTGDKEGNTSSTANGDTEQYDGFHYDTHYNAGLMDVLGWGNLTYMKIGAAFDPKEDLKVGLDYYMFTATEDAAAATNLINGTATAGNKKDDAIGTEIDVWVTKTYSSNFNTTLRYGQFAPGDRYTADDTATQIYLEGMMTF